MQKNKFMGPTKIVGHINYGMIDLQTVLFKQKQSPEVFY